MHLISTSLFVEFIILLKTNYYYFSNMDSVQSSHGVRHITSNFRMFGFDENMALFQSVKELSENSLDATAAVRMLVPRKAEVNINIKPHNLPNMCILEVLDNGSGIADIPSALGTLHLKLFRDACLINATCVIIYRLFCYI
jgi:hypothetical protein